LYQAVKENSFSDYLKIVQDKKLNLGHDTFLWIFTLAAKYGRVPFAQAVVDAGVCVNDQDCNGNSGVLLAARYGHENMVNYLINSNCNPNLCNKIKRLPLHLACEYGQSKCVEILLSVVQDVNAVDGTNEPPIVLASRHGHTSVAKVLIEAKCDIERPSQSDQLRRRALHYAACFGYAELADVILHAGARPDVSDGAGNSPLMLATA
jgi:ankyrin repeat protein